MGKVLLLITTLLFGQESEAQEKPQSVRTKWERYGSTKNNDIFVDLYLSCWAIDSTMVKYEMTSSAGDFPTKTNYAFQLMTLYLEEVRNYRGEDLTERIAMGIAEYELQIHDYLGQLYPDGEAMNVYLNQLLKDLAFCTVALKE